MFLGLLCSWVWFWNKNEFFYHHHKQDYSYLFSKPHPQFTIKYPCPLTPNNIRCIIMSWFDSFAVTIATTWQVEMFAIYSQMCFITFITSHQTLDKETRTYTHAGEHIKHITNIHQKAYKSTKWYWQAKDNYNKIVNTIDWPS